MTPPLDTTLARPVDPDVHPSGPMRAVPSVREDFAGQYVVLREIARGGIGAVFEAEHVLTRRRVALKVMTPDGGLRDEMVLRFLREARSAARLTHPNIVTVLDMGVGPDGAPYLVQELLEGEDLRQRLARAGRLDLAEAERILGPILDALALAHDHGIVHRDVKPANVFLSRRDDGEIVPKLVDFGVVKMLGGDSLGGLTEQGAMIGTPQYMAPEQLSGSGEIGPHTDVWSAAVTLYEMVVGRPPFVAPNLPALVERIRVGAVPRPSSVCAGLPRALDAVLRRGLARDPSKRTPSMRQMRADLADVVAGGDPVAEGKRAARRGMTPTEPVRGTPHLRWRVGLVATTPELEGPGMVEVFSEALGARCDVLRSLSYAELVDALADGALDLAWLPPVAYIRARRAGAARLLVSVERGASDGYASALLARADNSFSILELAGKRAVWVDRWSAAGYVVPMGMLRARDIDPDQTFASQGFLGSHHAVIAALREGTADVAASFCAVDAAGDLTRRAWRKSDGLRTLAVSATIPGDTVCAGRHVSDEAVDAAVRALSDVDGARKLLAAMGATRLAIGERSRYDGLERALGG